MDAPVGERAVGGRHVEQRHVGRPEDVGVDLLDGRLDAEPPAHVDHPFGAHRHRELGVDGVDRAAGGLDQRHPLGFGRLLTLGDLGQVVAGGAAAYVPDAVLLGGAGDVEFDLVGCRIGGRDPPAGLHGGGQSDGFHGGTGLAAVADGQVDLGVLVLAEEVAPADHGEDVAVLGIHDDDGGVRVPLAVRQVCLDGCLGGELEPEVDGGLDPQAALEEQLLALCPADPERLVVEEPAADLLDEVAGGIAGVEPVGVLLELGWGGLGVGVLGLGDELVGQHPVEDQVAAPQAVGVVAERVEAAGGLDEARQHGGLVDGEVHDVLVEVRLGGGLDAVGAVAEVHGVEVLEEDEVLGVLVLEAQGVPELLELPGGGLLGVLDDRQLDVLLGDRGTALADAAGLEVGAGGPDDGLQVDAVVLVEALVLDGDDGVADQFGDLVEGPGAGAVLRGDQGGDERAVAGDDDRGLGGLGNRDLERAGLVGVAAGGQHRRGQQRADEPPGRVAPGEGVRQPPVGKEPPWGRGGRSALGGRHTHSLAADGREGASAETGSPDEKVGIGRSQRPR